jgi:hypothetical protein
MGSTGGLPRCRSCNALSRQCLIDALNWKTYIDQGASGVVMGLLSDETGTNHGCQYLHSTPHSFRIPESSPFAIH